MSFTNKPFVTAASLLPLFTGNYSSFSKGKQGKTVSIKMDNRKSDFQNRAAAARRTALTGAWGSASTSRKTIRSVKAEWMVFRICIYRCIACDYYTKFGIKLASNACVATILAATKVASNAYGAPYAKNSHFCFGRFERFPACWEISQAL